MNTIVSIAILALAVAAGYGNPANLCDFPCTEPGPVCGSDGNTYPRECDLKRFDCVTRGLIPVTVAYRGECVPSVGPCVLLCTRDYNPVCGTDGNTYSNECALKSADCLSGEESAIRVAYKGECGAPIPEPLGV